MVEDYHNENPFADLHELTRKVLGTLHLSSGIIISLVLRTIERHFEHRDDEL